MKKVIATIIKEWQVLRRDLAGLALLLLMPAVLIVVMAMVQDAPFKDFQDVQFELLVADSDKSSLGKEIKNGLRESKHFKVIDSLDNKAIEEQELKALIFKGTYKVGIIIPKGATAEIANATNKIANAMAQKMGQPAGLATRDKKDDINVQVFFDPISKPTFKMSIQFALDRLITYASSQLLMARLDKLSQSASDNMDSTAAAQTKLTLADAFQAVGIVEETAYKGDKRPVAISSVQHNVPAWTLFGMFLIVVPLAGNMIRERDEGSAFRMALIPGTRRQIALGKIVFYVIICMLQFVLMLAIGIWILPLLGLEHLVLGTHPVVLFFLVLSIAFVATSYGYFIGSVFDTANQAMPFGAISVVIMSAIGGLWVPVDVLPPLMKKAALISPQNWGLSAINELFLRNGTFKDVWKEMLALCSVGALFWMLSSVKNAYKSYNTL